MRQLSVASEAIDVVRGRRAVRAFALLNGIDSGKVQRHLRVEFKPGRLVASRMRRSRSAEGRQLNPVESPNRLSDDRFQQIG
jgi:hypothetical protein